MKKQIALVAVILFAACVAMARRPQVSGSTTLTVIPASGNSSLLSGQTPASCTTDGCGVPGWHTGVKEDFEGALGPGEHLFGQGGCGAPQDTAITTLRNHTPGGTRSAFNTVCAPTAVPGNQQSPDGFWQWGPGVACCTNGEFYVSAYIYFDSNGQPAQFGNELVFEEVNGGPIGGQGTGGQAILQDTENYDDGGAGDILSNTQWYWASPQTGLNPNVDCNVIGDNHSPNAQNCAFSDATFTVAIGRWQQIELWYRESTCTSGVSNEDSFLRFYQDGNLVYQEDPQHNWGFPMAAGNMNGCLDMSTNSSVQVAGVVTYFMHMTNPFNKYWDDIIVLKR